MPTVEANGITIAYEEYGSGPPLLLIMGLGGQLVDWSEGFVQGLAAHFRVVAFDNRDIGLSSEVAGAQMTPAGYIKALITRRKPESGYLLSDMSSDAVGLMDVLNIRSAHVAGISMGGMIAQTMAIEHRSRVRSMTSIMSNTGDRKNGRTAPSLLTKLVRRRPPTRKNAADMFVDGYKLMAGPVWDEQEVRAKAEASVARSWRPAGTARQLAAINASPDRTAALATVTAPTLVIHGLMDPLVKPSGGIATANAVPGSRLLMFPDMGHDLPASRWQEMTNAILTNAHRAERPVVQRL